MLIVSILVIKELLGHQDVKTTMIYSHLRSEDLRNAINALNN
jgi:site-specific recombinase XerD